MIDIPPVDLRQLVRDSCATMRVNGNYKRTALMLGLFMLLVNVPLLAIELATTGLGSISEMTAETVALVNNRNMIASLLMQAFVAPAFQLSACRFMIRTVREGVAGRPGELFDGLGGGNYFVSVRATLWMGLMLYAWGMAATMLAELVILPAGMAAGPLNSALPFTVFLVVVVGVVLINRLLAYNLQFYLLADDTRIGAIASLRASVGMMRGRKLEFFRLVLRLLPFTLPPLLAGFAPQFFYTDSMAFSALMALLTIVLTALLRPVAECANAGYYCEVRKRIEAVIMPAHVEAEYTVGDPEPDTYKSPYESPDAGRNYGSEGDGSTGGEDDDGAGEAQPFRPSAGGDTTGSPPRGDHRDGGDSAF